MRQTRRNRGYVLVMTLLLLAIAASVTSTLCISSLRKTLEAAEAQEQLQVRWATLSCQEVFLPRAEELLQSQEKATRQPAVLAYREIILGGMPFEIIAADEQAKLNVNLVYARRGSTGTERLVQALIPADNEGLLTCRLAPERVFDEKQGDNANAFSSFGQVFATDSPRLLAPVRRRAQSAPAALLTCWGDRRINFRRASRETLEEGCAPALSHGAAAKLLQARTREPELELATLMDKLAVTNEQRREIQERLTNRSDCHSLWVVATGKRRSWYQLSVRHVQRREENEQQDDREPQAVTYTFRW